VSSHLMRTNIIKIRCLLSLFKKKIFGDALMSWQHHIMCHVGGHIFNDQSAMTLPFKTNYMYTGRTVVRLDWAIYLTVSTLEYDWTIKMNECWLTWPQMGCCKILMYYKQNKKNRLNRYNKHLDNNNYIYIFRNIKNPNYVLFLLCVCLIYQSWMFVLLMMPHVGPMIRQSNVFYSILFLL
jgi:hypothetical protein